MASDARSKADEFLQAQQHYYTNLKAKKDEMQRYRASRQQHEDAAKLLADLPTKVPALPSLAAGLVPPGGQIWQGV